MKKSTDTKKPARDVASQTLVGILTGSPNDLPTVVKVRDTLTELGIPSEIVVASAHRTPDKVIAYIERAHREGVQVLIGCAGMAAHLAGVIAGHTRLPVIGLPLSGGHRLRSGRPAFHSADAAWRTGRHRGGGRCEKCRDAGGADTGVETRGDR
jgi:NCAIR mutase (PurE)-related protein